jgi:hypothetical protein
LGWGDAYSTFPRICLTIIHTFPAALLLRPRARYPNPVPLRRSRQNGALLNVVSSYYRSSGSSLYNRRNLEIAHQPPPFGRNPFSPISISFSFTASSLAMKTFV